MNIRDIEIKSKIWFERSGKPVFGEGRYRILKAVDLNGSISAEARFLMEEYERAAEEGKLFMNRVAEERNVR